MDGPVASLTHRTLSFGWVAKLSPPTCGNMVRTRSDYCFRWLISYSRVRVGSVREAVTAVAAFSVASLVSCPVGADALLRPALGFHKVMSVFDRNGAPWTYKNADAHANETTSPIRSGVCWCLVLAGLRCGWAGGHNGWRAGRVFALGAVANHPDCEDGTAPEVVGTSRVQ